MSNAIHTEGCYADCGGLVVFTDRRGTCPTCGIVQRVEPVVRRVYTAGYVNRSLATLIGKVNQLGALVFDIRFEPVSKFKPWRLENLKQVFDDAYRHVPELGNRNYLNRAAGIEIVDLQAGVAQVLKARQPVILLCGCASAETCHRAIVAQAVRERGHIVSELEW